MNAGAELAQARQKLGLSLEDVSSRTKISVERLSAIEAMNREALPSFVYLKGFLRAYATEVELDPDDVVPRYLDEAQIEAPVNPAAAEIAASLDAKSNATDPDDVEEALDVEPALAASAVFPEEPIASEPIATDETAFFKVYGADFAVEQSPRLAPMAIVAFVAVLVGFVLAANVDTIGRFVPTMPATRDARASAPASTRSAPSDAAPATAASDSVANQPAANAVAESDATPATDVRGWWMLTNQVKSTNVGAYENLSLGFRLRLQQNGDRVTGTGQKWMENGRAIPAKARTPIAVDGTLHGRRLELTFSERGDKRPSAGTLVLNVTDDGTLRGTFASDAANAHGTSTAKRLKSPQ